MRRSKFALVLVVSLVIAAPASAAVDVFLKIPGLPGFSTDAKHQGWTEVLSQSLVVGQSPAEKEQDIASQCAASFAAQFGAGIAAAVQLVGAPIAGEVLVDHVHPQTGQVIAEIKLHGAVIVAVASSHPNPTENVSLNFTRIEYKTYFQKEDGTISGSVYGTYDCTKSKK